MIQTAFLPLNFYTVYMLHWCSCRGEMPCPKALWQHLLKEKANFSSLYRLFQSDQQSDLQAAQAYTNRSGCTWEQIQKKLHKISFYHIKGNLTVIFLEIHLFVQPVPEATNHPVGLRMKVKHLMLYTWPNIVLKKHFVLHRSKVCFLTFSLCKTSIWGWVLYQQQPSLHPHFHRLYLTGVGRSSLTFEILQGYVSLLYKHTDTKFEMTLENQD